jgi:hypothetical protein
MRTEFISTSRLKTYKKVYRIFIVSSNVVALGIAVPLIFQNGNYSSLLFLPGLWFLSWRALKEFKKLRTISYDASSIYYDKDGYEVQVPFEDIKNIELYRGWRINLYRPSQDGNSIMFTPSVWYPFNFIGKEKRINKLRDKIDEYKRTLPEANNAQMSSFQI